MHSYPHFQIGDFNDNKKSVLKDFSNSLITMQFCLRSNIKHSTHSFITIEVRQKYSTARRIFNYFIGVSPGVETLRLMLDILHQKI